MHQQTRVSPEARTSPRWSLQDPQRHPDQEEQRLALHPHGCLPCGCRLLQRCYVLQFEYIWALSTERMQLAGRETSSKWGCRRCEKCRLHTARSAKRRCACSIATTIVCVLNAPLRFDTKVCDPWSARCLRYRTYMTLAARADVIINGVFTLCTPCTFRLLCFSVIEDDDKIHRKGCLIRQMQYCLMC